LNIYIADSVIDIKQTKCSDELSNNELKNK